MAPDAELLALIKDWVWIPATGLVAWAWKRNEAEHDAMRGAQDKLRDSHGDFRNSTTAGYSTMNDRIMDHIDERIRETKQFVQIEDAKLVAELNVQRGHITKVFDKIDEHVKRSEDRHVELLTAMHTMTNSFHEALSRKADK